MDYPSFEISEDTFYRIDKNFLYDRIFYSLDMRDKLTNFSNLLISLLILVNSISLIVSILKKQKILITTLSINLFVLAGSILVFLLFMQYPEDLWYWERFQPAWFKVNRTLFYDYGHGEILNGTVKSFTLYNYTNMFICFLILFNLTNLILSFKKKK